MASPNNANISTALQAITQALQSFSQSLQSLTQAGAGGALSPQAAQIISQVMVDISKGIASIGAASASLGNAAGNANKANTAFSSLDKTMGTLTGSAIKVQIGLQFFTHALEKAIGSLGTQFTRFVQLANPATVIRFNRAMENFTSAIGQILTPVLEKLTPIVQQFANAIVSLDEPTRKLLAGLALGSALAGALSAVVAAISAIIAVLGSWVAILIALGSAVAGMVIMSEDSKKVMEQFSGILSSFGTVLQAVAKPIAAMLLKIGEVVSGLMEAMNPLIEAFGELFTAVFELTSIPLQILLGVVKALSPVIAGLGKVIAAVVRIVALLVDIFAKAAGGAIQKIGEIILKAVIPAIEVLAEALAWLVNKLIDAYNLINKLNPFAGPAVEKFDPNKNRAQATVKNASIGGVQDFLSRAYTQSATGSGQTIPQKQLDKLGQINEGIRGVAKDIVDAIKNMPIPAQGAPAPMMPNIPQGGGVAPMKPAIPVPGGDQKGDIGRLNRDLFKQFAGNLIPIPALRNLWKAAF